MDNEEIVGFIIYRDEDDSRDMEVLRDSQGVASLFTEYSEAKSYAAWLDVVSPISQERYTLLNSKKVPRGYAKPLLHKDTF